MNDLLKLLEERRSGRGPFDKSRAIAKGDLLQILEAARWSPTAHNMSMPYPWVRCGVVEFTHRNHFGNPSLDQSHRQLDRPAAESMRT
jgi:nitroreductase